MFHEEKGCSACSCAVKEVEAFKILGTTITKDLKLETNTCPIIKRAHSGMFFLRQLRELNVSRLVLTQFYRATTESILSSSISVWFGSVSALAKKKQKKQAAKNCANSREADWAEADLCQ